MIELGRFNGCPFHDFESANQLLRVEGLNYRSPADNETISRKPTMYGLPNTIDRQV